MYLGDFENNDDIIREFRIDGLDKNIEIIFAVYDCEYYEGQAFVLYRQGNKLYEVNGGHCSCYGLEDQWDPEETSIEVLQHRVKNGHLGAGYFYNDLFAKKLEEVINKLGE